MAGLRWVFLNEGTPPWVAWLGRHGIDPSRVMPSTLLLCDDDACCVVYDQVVTAAGGIGGWGVVEATVQLEAPALPFPEPDQVNPAT